MNPFVEVIRLFRKDALDPVHNCLVYKTVGCAHVDGPLCDLKTCNVKVEITPGAVSDIDNARAAIAKATGEQE